MRVVIDTNIWVSGLLCGLRDIRRPTSPELGQVRARFHPLCERFSGSSVSQFVAFLFLSFHFFVLPVRLGSFTTDAFETSLTVYLLYGIF